MYIFISAFARKYLYCFIRECDICDNCRVNALFLASFLCINNKKRKKKRIDDIFGKTQCVCVASRPVALTHAMPLFLPSCNMTAN